MRVESTTATCGQPVRQPLRDITGMFRTRPVIVSEDDPNAATAVADFLRHCATQELIITRDRRGKQVLDALFDGKGSTIPEECKGVRQVIPVTIHTWTEEEGVKIVEMNFTFCLKGN